MPSLRDIRRRIQSVKNTRQITRAMKLVAGAKLKRATDAAVAARPYQQTLRRVLERVVAAAGDVEHPLLTVPNNDTDVLVVLITSDRGLCGAFNNNLCRATQEQVDALQAKGKRVRLVTYGKKGRAYFEKRGYTVEASHIGITPVRFAEAADHLAAELVTGLVGDRFSQAILACNEFKSVMSQKPVFQPILPMRLDRKDGAATGGDYLFEPAGQEILAELLPMALRTQLFQAFLETEAGEQAARMTAMDSATRNASELIDKLTLTYNRARQAYITKELIEIVSGAEAL
jgi:F-type H+-transporting ATPase subunit gamma